MAQQHAQPLPQPLPQPRFDVLATGFQQIGASFAAVAPELGKLPNIDPVVQHQEIMGQFARLHTDIGQIRTDITNTNNRIDALNTQLGGQINALGTRLDERIDALGTRLDERIDALGTRLDGRIDTLNTQLRGQINALGTRLDGRIDALNTQLGGRIDMLHANIDGLAHGLDNRFEATATNNLAIAVNSKFLRGQNGSRLRPLVNVKTAMIIPDFPDCAGEIDLMSRAELETVLLALGHRTLPTQTDNDLKAALEHRVGLLWN